MECTQRSCSSAAVDEQSAGGSSSLAENMHINTIKLAENMHINTTKRVCHVCNKEFESGQALGGHMRIHAQPVNKQQSGFKNYSVSCVFCAKKFLSLKSLFDHMKCHPKRDWTGIRPPFVNYSSSLSEDDDYEDEDEDGINDGDMVVDSTQLVPKWPVKARRGDIGIKSGLADGYEDDEEEKKLRDCVNNLMLLSKVMDSSDTSGLSDVVVEQINGGHEHKGEESDDISYVGNGFYKQAKRVYDCDMVPIMRKMGSEEGGSSDHVMMNCDIGFVGQGNVNANGADHVLQNHHVEAICGGINTELVLGSIGGNMQFDGINDKDTHGVVMGNSKNNKDKKIKIKMGLEPPGEGCSVQVAGSWTANDKYKCSTCDKTFSSHQALGGHRSSHNKFKVTIINGDSSTKNPVFAPPEHKFDQQQHLSTSHDQVNRLQMRDEECITKRNVVDEEVAGSSKAAEHQCSVCHKIFASGQALGGHKRSHWTAPPAGAQTEEQAQPLLEARLVSVRTSSEEASTQVGAKRIRLMGFDLNVPASMVDTAAQDGGTSW